MSDSSGNPDGAYAYGAWGDVLAAPGTWQPYQYVGQLGYYTHTTSQGAEVADWLQLGVRFYDPDLGRFERRDPVKVDAVSEYLYAFARAAGTHDPTGRNPGEALTGQGQFCVDSSCHGVLHTVVTVFPDYSQKTGEPAPEAPKCGRNCVDVDKIEPFDIPVKLTGLAKRKGERYLKIRGGHRCTLYCKDPEKGEAEYGKHMEIRCGRYSNWGMIVPAPGGEWRDD